MNLWFRDEACLCVVVRGTRRLGPSLDMNWLHSRAFPHGSRTKGLESEGAVTGGGASATAIAEVKYYDGRKEQVSMAGLSLSRVHVRSTFTCTQRAMCTKYHIVDVCRLFLPPLRIISFLFR